MQQKLLWHSKCVSAFLKKLLMMFILTSAANCLKGTKIILNYIQKAKAAGNCIEQAKELKKLISSLQRPREQIADAEALLDITTTLVKSVRSQSSEGITPSDFVTALLKKFGQQATLDSEPGSLR